MVDSQGRPSVRASEILSKVPEVTLAFWVIKICATTVGETGGDALSMTFDLGYAVSTLIFLAFFIVTVVGQVRATRYHPFLYWAVVVATTTVGTTLSDYLDRTVGLGYVVSSVGLFGAVLVVLALWRRTTGAIRFDHIVDRTDETFYWVTILVANTLGTALGDFTATTAGLGFGGGALLFSGLLAVIAVAHLLGRLPAALAFWSAYVLTRPLGATLGDTLTKPHAEGGLDLSRVTSTLVIAVVMVIAIVATSRRAASPALGESSTP